MFNVKGFLLKFQIQSTFETQGYLCALINQTQLADFYLTRVLERTEDGKSW